MGTGKKRKVPPEERLSVEKVADRFNQVTQTLCFLFSTYAFKFLLQNKDKALKRLFEEFCKISSSKKVIKQYKVFLCFILI